MSMKYVIRWKSKVNGRAGRGTKEFSLEEGEQLVEELNRDYPGIEHELMRAPPAEAPPAVPLAEEPVQEQEPQPQEAQTHASAPRPLYELSLK